MSDTIASDAESTAAPATTTKSGNVFGRVYRGQTTFDFVGRRNVWFTISIVIIAAGIVALGVRGLNLGIDFKGGSSWEVAVQNVNVADATKAMETAGFYNTVGFNDDTRAFPSIPARHDVARRVDAGFLAELVADHRLREDEAHELAHDLTYRLVKDAYKL